MPPVVGAVAIALSISTLAATVLVSLAVLAVSALVASLMMPKIPELESQSRKVTIKSGIAPCRIIYGEYFGGGVQIFATTTGGDNKYLHIVYVHCCHEVEEISEVWFGDKPSTHADFNDGIGQGSVFGFLAAGIATLAGTTSMIVGSDIYNYDYGIGETSSDVRDALYALLPGTNDYDFTYGQTENTSGELIDAIFVRRINFEYSADWDFITGLSIGSGAGLTPTDYDIFGRASSSNWFRINHHLGTEDQAADSDLVSEVTEWTSAHRLRGCAYTYIRFKFDDNTDEGHNPVWTSVPRVKFRIKGKQDIYDPRDGATGYKINWALCIRDYLLSSDGLNVKPERLPETEWNAAADICDELFKTNPKYVLNGAFTLDQRPPDILEAMKTAAHGQIVYTSGIWLAKPAAYDPPVKTITTDDLIAGITITPSQSKYDTANIIEGSYIEPDALWSSMEYPAVRNEEDIARFGEVSDTVDLPYTIDAHIAQMLAGLRLGFMKYNETIKLEMNLSGVDICAWDVIALDIPEIWDGKPEFRVVSVSIGLAGVTIICQQEDANIYVPVDTVDVDVPARLYVTDTRNIYDFFGSYGWTEIISFLNSWEAYSSTYPVRYSINADGIVSMQGQIKNGTVSTTSTGYAFLLPSGYRPLTERVVVALTDDGTAEIRILTTGYVHIYSESGTGASTRTSLSQISFQT